MLRGNTIMAVQNKVSLPVIKRLPKYYRYLTNFRLTEKRKFLPANWPT